MNATVPTAEATGFTATQKLSISDLLRANAYLVGVALLFALAGCALYLWLEPDPKGFFKKAAELMLQVAVLLGIGAYVKKLADDVTSVRSRHDQKIQRRSDFLRRLRNIHVIVQHARDLFAAHGTRKTWSEQSRRLMELRPQVEELSEDLKIATGLFNHQTEIIDGLERIASYLANGREEYKNLYKDVESAAAKARSDLLEDIMKELVMPWTRDFISGGEQYSSEYEHCVKHVKTYMRADVFAN